MHRTANKNDVERQRSEDEGMPMVQPREEDGDENPDREEQPSDGLRSMEQPTECQRRGSE